jgi:hypothetical protein
MRKHKLEKINPMQWLKLVIFWLFGLWIMLEYIEVYQGHTVTYFIGVQLTFSPQDSLPKEQPKTIPIKNN